MADIIAFMHGKAKASRELLNDTPPLPGESEDARMTRVLRLEAEMIRRKLVAIRGPEFAIEVLTGEIAAVRGAENHQKE